MAKKKAKKKTATKKTVKTVKKAAKVVKNSHEGKRYFMLEFSGYGGEFIAAKTTEEFVKYWLDKKRETSLDEHVMAMHEGALSRSDDMLDEEENDEVTLDLPDGFDENSPEVSEGVKFVEYWELGDIEHDTVLAKEGSSFTVQEIVLNSKAVYKDGELDWDDKECRKKNFDWSQEKFTVKKGTESKDYATDSLQIVYSQEMFIYDNKKEAEKPVPALICYDAQKGTFFRLFVETNGEDFDVNKLIVGVNENNMTEHITEFFYDKTSLSQNHDWLSTWGKGFSAAVGYMSQYDLDFNREEWLKEGWKDLEG